MLAGENIGEFGDCPLIWRIWHSPNSPKFSHPNTIRQSFPIQIYLKVILPMFSTTNVLHYTVLGLLHEVKIFILVLYVFHTHHYSSIAYTVHDSLVFGPCYQQQC